MPHSITDFFTFYFISLQLNYVLDRNRPKTEIIVKEGPICLTREDFWSLGLQRDMGSLVSSM